jgi:Zn-dependent peptidase ImmA (M78 family)
LASDPFCSLRFVHERDIKQEADSFAAQLLMPLDDFRKQMGSTTLTLDLLGACAGRYGVSLTATLHRWLEHTQESALLVVSGAGLYFVAEAAKRTL